MFMQFNEDGTMTFISSEKSHELLKELIKQDIEYNSNTSAQHPTCNDEDDDIVWPIWKHIDSWDKEPMR